MGVRHRERVGGRVHHLQVVEEVPGDPRWPSCSRRGSPPRCARRNLGALKRRACARDPPRSRGARRGGRAGAHGTASSPLPRPGSRGRERRRRWRKPIGQEKVSEGCHWTRSPAVAIETTMPGRASPPTPLRTSSLVASAAAHPSSVSSSRRRRKSGRSKRGMVRTTWRWQTGASTFLHSHSAQRSCRFFSHDGQNDLPRQEKATSTRAQRERLHRLAPPEQDEGPRPVVDRGVEAVEALKGVEAEATRVLRRRERGGRCGRRHTSPRGRGAGRSG